MANSEEIRLAHPQGPPATQWRLPLGTTRGVWDYIHAPHIAEDYDERFANNSLFDFDQSVLDAHFTRAGRIVDLGAGTGRLLIPFARRGYPCLAVDLSPYMLQVVGRKATADNLSIDRLCANLAQLGCLADRCAPYAICMFSTLGMIHGAAARLAVVRHAWRLLEPGGQFVVHVHNVWHNLFDPQGRWWLAGSARDAVWRRGHEFGDKIFDDRGIRNMFLHVFTRGELSRLLAKGGFRLRKFIALDTARRHALPRPWLLGRLRANGWIVVCTK